jgi:hypothetical protein
MPCMGEICPYSGSKILKCDDCGVETEELYILADTELCAECVFDRLERIRI